MKLRFHAKLVVLFALLGVSFSYGVLVGGWRFPPFGLIRKLRDVILRRNVNDTVAPHYYETDVRSLIEVRTNDDVSAKRAALCQFIWGRNGPPLTLAPRKVEVDIDDGRYRDLENLQQIDRLTVEMEWGLQSVCYHFVPKERNGQFVIYHQGHGGDFVIGRPVIGAVLAKGYAVVGMSMPLLGVNNRPVVSLKRFGRLRIEFHDCLRFIAPKVGHPVRYFVDPVVAVINYASAQGNRQVAMIGFSGGGWTTTLSAAVDVRIARSYPVAGTLPLYLRSGSGYPWGDYEQTVRGLYEIANYLELYVLGAVGDASRAQMQILNKHAPCIYAGTGYLTYERIVGEIVEELGSGRFGVVLDDTHRQHMISKWAVRRILEDLEDDWRLDGD